MQILELEISKLFVGDTNVRKNVGDISELAASVKINGILQPLVVRPSGKRYEVIVGSRRLEAARTANLKKVPVVVSNFNDDEAVIVSLTENVQRRAIDPEEEYDALVKLREMGSGLEQPRYQTDEELAKAIGKSRQHVTDVMKAVEVVRVIRDRTKSDIAVKQSPSAAERSKGVLPVGQATLLHSAEQSQSVQDMPEKRRARKLGELADTIAPLPRDRAAKVVEHFVLSPEKPMDVIKQEAMSSHVSAVTVSLEPRVAEALKRASQERGISMETVAAMAIEVWLKGWKYL
jgi:ParB/RepB/Spo0J family partition protein